MPYQVLARKYRPLQFSDVVGQDHVTVTLMNALSQGRIAHGYIFSGHRGIGKTTIARILASALNCRNAIGSDLRPTPEPCLVCDSCLEIRSGNAVDVIEIDAATNRGIDDIRELRDAARYRPARDKYKIYILDEAHQITDAAFNALLKTLEEPPEHIVFMMATTQPEDIPQTVRSRCQHFSFHAVKLADILGQLRSIAQAENVLADDAALALLAEAGDGSMRDALSIMDQAIASAPTDEGRPQLDASQIRELMGTVPNAVFERILDAVNSNSSAEVITIANQLLDAGNSPQQLARQCVRYLRNSLIANIAGLKAESVEASGLGGELLQISPEEQRRAARSAALFSEEELTRFLQVMLRTFDELGYRQEQRFHLELGLLKLVHLRRLLPLEEALSQMPGRASSSGPRSGASAPGAIPNTAASNRGASRPPMGAQPALAAQPAPAAVAERPAFSPFDQDRNRRRPEGSVSSGPAMPASSAPMPLTVPASRAATAVSIAHQVREMRDPIPMPAPVQLPDAVSISLPSALEEDIEQQPEPVIPPPVFEPVAPARQFESSLIATAAPAPEQTHVPGDEAQRVALEALSAARQESAADALSDSTWTISDGEARVQTEVSKTMLPLVLNAEAEKVIRAALRGIGISRVNFLPGAGAAAAAKKPRAARTGSAHARALEHPLVQQAQKLFSAEIQTVIDLREDLRENR